MRIESNSKLVYKELSYKINGILFAVHNELGRFRNEKEYCDSMENHLKSLKVNYEREKLLPPSFEGEQKGRNRIDFLVEDKILLEVKTKKAIERIDYYQVQRYLSAMDKKLAILVNFHQRYLVPRRILNSSASN